MAKTLGLAVTIGLLLGFLLVWWVSPATSQGSIFLVVLCVLVSSLIAAVVRAMRKEGGM